MFTIKIFTSVQLQFFRINWHRASYFHSIRINISNVHSPL